MKAKTVIGIAVASALSWSYGAMAGNYGHMDKDSTYGAVTPFSPNEAGPAALPHGERYSSVGQGFDSAGIPADQEVVTPLASNEAGPNEDMVRPHRTSFRTASASGSMANPQTPWSPNEGGLNTFNEDMEERTQQVAEVERARVAAAEWNANLASAGSFDTTASVSEPIGSTSGIGLQGSNERFVDPSRHSSISDPSGQSSSSEASAQQDQRSEAGMPAEVERTSAMRPESEQPIPVYEYNTVGILETPAVVTEHTVWSVEPLTPEADLASGDTIYLVPDGAEVAFVPEFGTGSPLGTSGDYSAGVMESESGETSESSSL